MAIASERRVWLAILFPAGVADVVGAVRASVRLHWTVQEARDEAERWVEEMRIGSITWGAADEQIVVGRTPTHVAVVRGIPLPRGDHRPVRGQKRQLQALQRIGSE
jgi:hypothetical protein